MKWTEWINNTLKTNVTFPIIADGTGRVAKQLGMIPSCQGSNTVRAVFIVDPTGTIRTILYYPQEVGRNMDEIQRTVRPFRFSDQNKVAHWRSTAISVTSRTPSTATLPRLGPRPRRDASLGADHDLQSDELLRVAAQDITVSVLDDAATGGLYFGTLEPRERARRRRPRHGSGEPRGRSRRADWRRRQRAIRSYRADPDEDGSGTGELGSLDDQRVLSLGEVVVIGEGPLPRPDINYARHGTAEQSTTCWDSFAQNGIDGSLGDFTHTCTADTTPWWKVTLPEDVAMHMIVVYNRTSCCGSRLRDITVSVLDAAEQAVFTSALLNPENTGYSYPNGPARLTVDLVAETGGPVTGRIVRVARTIDDDLSERGDKATLTNRWSSRSARSRSPARALTSAAPTAPVSPSRGRAAMPRGTTR